MPVRDFNDNIRLNAQKHIDERYGPHLTIANALSFIPAFRRVQGLTVGIREFGNSTDPIVEYWWRNGITDADLILKNPGTPDGYFVHTQGIAAVVWDVVHNLNKRPAVHVETVSGMEIITQVIYLDNSRVRIFFGTAMAGRAICN